LQYTQYLAILRLLKTNTKKLKNTPFFFVLLLSFFAANFAFAQNCGGLATNYSDIIHVSPTGGNSGAATAADPVNLLTGMGMLGGNADKMYLQAGTYVLTAPLAMQSNVQLIGGFNVNWVKDNTALTTIFRDTSNVQPGPPRLIAINCSGISNFRLEALTIRTSNTFQAGVSTYGIYLNNCADYNIVRCRIVAGNAGTGAPGAPGVGGALGENGQPGQLGEETDSGNRVGGTGACCSYPGSNGGGNGGNGGERGTYDWPNDGEAFPGYSGTVGIGIGPGALGVGGQGNFRAITPTSCDRSVSNDGDFGGNGSPGLPGADGFLGNSGMIGGFYIPGFGTPGLSGTNAAGGGGGGEGGGAALGGAGGQGGGGSFGVFTWDNGFNGVMKDCELESGFAGFGGPGGFGGNGGQGGNGGAGGSIFTACYIGAGGDGGDGGDGGNGGDGGLGSNGITQELYQHPGGEPMVLQNIYGLSQPAVSVNFGGCTNAPVTFYTEATGTLQWFFGAGATPSSAFGQSAVASFSTPGFKTFTLVVNGIAFTYTDYIDIHAVVPPLDPQIQTGVLELCEGDVADFNSSVSANNYTWQLNNVEGDTVTYNGSNYFNLSGVAFDSAGVYQLTLTTETECCGQAFSDTIMIVVDSIVLPMAAIQSDFADNTNTVCQLTEVTFTATAQNVGSTPNYQWMINGNAAGGNSPVFTTDQLQDGDEVTMMIVSSLGCATGETFLSNGISVTVIPPPLITCQADSFISGSPTLFQVAVTSGGLAPFEYFWTFGDGTLGFGEQVAHIYQDPGAYTATVDVQDSLGCSVSCQTTMIISPNLSAEFSVTALTGCAPLEVAFVNQSENAVSNFWDFGDGGSSNETDPTYVYTTAGIYDVSLWVYSGTGNDSASVFNQIVVNPAPVANFQNYELNPTQGSDTVQFADNSLFANSWLWNFDDPSSGADNTSTEQNPLHVFASNGNYNVTLWVTNNFGCADSITISSSVNVGIENLAQDMGSFIYPNPVSEQLTVMLFSQEKRNAHLQVFNVLGETVYTDAVVLVSGINEMRIHVAQLAEGTYVLQLQTENAVRSYPFVVER